MFLARAVWRRYKKRNTFQEEYPFQFAVKKSFFNKVSTTGIVSLSVATAERRLANSEYKNTVKIFKKGVFFLGSIPLELLTAKNFLTNSFNCYLKQVFTLVSSSSKEKFIKLKSAWQFYMTIFTENVNVDLIQQYFRVAKKKFRVVKWLYPKKYKRQQRFTAYRAYLRIRRSFLGLTRRRYGYKNNNATRFATGQYFWSHHLLRCRILQVCGLSTMQFNKKVITISRTASKIGKIAMLAASLVVASRIFFYQYQFISKIQELKYNMQIAKKVFYVRTTNTHEHSCTNKTKISLSQLFIYKPETTMAHLQKYNYLKGFGMVANTARLLKKKLRQRQKLSVRQVKIGRCSAVKTITNAEWYQTSSTTSNNVNFTAGITFDLPTRHHNIFSKSYTINYKVLSIINRHTAS